MASIVVQTLNVLDSLLQLAFCRLIRIAQPCECWWYNTCDEVDTRGESVRWARKRERERNYLFLLEPWGSNGQAGMIMTACLWDGFFFVCTFTGLLEITFSRQPRWTLRCGKNCEEWETCRSRKLPITKGLKVQNANLPGSNKPHHAVIRQCNKLPKAYTKRMPDAYATKGIPTNIPSRREKSKEQMFAC